MFALCLLIMLLVGFIMGVTWKPIAWDVTVFVVLLLLILPKSGLSL